MFAALRDRTVFLAPGVRLGIPTFDELRRIVRHIGRVLADSNNTADIIRAEAITSKAQLRHLAEEARRTPEGRALLAARPELPALEVEPLRALPAGTLGRALVDYLDANGLDFHIGDELGEYGSATDADYLGRRLGKTHDFTHVLLELGPEGHEEVLVHAFTLAQSGRPSSLAIVALGALKHMVLEGRVEALVRTLPRTIELGRRAKPLHLAPLEELLAMPLESARAALGLPASLPR